MLKTYWRLQVVYLTITKASVIVVIRQANRLHESVTDCWANKLKAAAQKVFTERFGKRGLRRHWRATFAPDRLAVDKAPEVRVETAEFFLDSNEGFRVLNCGANFQPVADNAGVQK